MKKISILTLIFIALNQLSATTGVGIIQFMNRKYTPILNKKYLQVNNLSDTNTIKSAFPTFQFLQTKSDDLHNIVTNLKTSSNVNLLPVFILGTSSNSIASFNSSTTVKYTAPFYMVDSNIIGISQFFNIRIKGDCDTTYLYYLASKYNFYVEARNKFMPRWYICRVDKNSAGNSLEISSLLVSDPNVENIEPDFLGAIHSTACNNTNDQFHGNQWNLSNTNQRDPNFSLDINMCNAWNISQGNSNIIVAVSDVGISRNHPDLPNLHTLSYNCETGLPVPTTNSTKFPFGSHGTEVAGVIGAQRNNTIGMAGIAPNCKIMDIAQNLEKPDSAKYYFSVLSLVRRANGINFAYKNGAAIINCSWYSDMVSPTIENAITDAISKGRNNLGTVVVFSAGNFGWVGFVERVKYPSGFDPNILCVGALHTYGRIAEDLSFGGYTSNYGNEMDILAPGVDIPSTYYDPTTVTNGYVQDFNLTSAAAPHVAGVAALILSVNPNLTQKQVCDIIEKTATKLPAYTSDYAITSGRANGTFFVKSGYGMLNAQAALTVTPPPVPTTCVTINVDNQNLTGSNTICNIINSKNTNVNSGTNVFDFVESTNINEGFVVKEGATFEIKTH